ncbi:MAG: peptidase U32 family protein [Candidatus Thiodiazotropha endolucinida]|uniref:Ubiquinone biosynthesis protein UbiU n=1 Tax=Candidatus Thiodiazotropha taylori TaxID=2792791 RepID=A0A9E4NHS3_9GAMM|nr:U32 family peptidase [Candidatus Thiodiazotropha sp. (ex Lucina pensylvanica)]MCG7864389.1 U32 family peptidase [Candidatus Thiodiazotropha endolucinida]MCG7877531.1 U32 family peptidase [Candidatus Thiodiazotropha taylori]MBT3093277.1 U32 family peptidase [Candidatus Thiodiazotropha sp. (ex Lucina pensylvanica)]MCG7882748.1 U32 family peptidase [Candidatus Thiodiazotropha taylori]
MELVCPAGNLPSLKAAVDNGADAIYFGLRNDTNARHFPGLNFNEKRAREGIAYAKEHGKRVFMAINTYPRPDGWERWRQAVDSAASLSVDALICADIGVLDYASRQWPELNLHLSVQASSTNYEALAFYHESFGIKRAVLPRVLSLSQVRQVVENTPVEIEIFGFGSLCVMVEGRCILSSYVTGESPNTHGACSPAQFVEYRETPQGLESRLGGLLTDRYGKHETAGYPTICKGRFAVGDNTFYAIEEPTSLNTLALLPELYRAGIKAIKIEGRQRTPAYVGQVTKVWREAIDSCLHNPDKFQATSVWNTILDQVSEGTSTTLGPYYRPWQ